MCPATSFASIELIAHMCTVWRCSCHHDLSREAGTRTVIAANEGVSVVVLQLTVDVLLHITRLHHSAPFPN
jgi:hypothetical protein